MADPENQDTNPEKAPESTDGGGGGGGQIGFTMEYVTSIPGIIKIVQFVSSFLIVYYWLFSNSS